MSFNTSILLDFSIPFNINNRGFAEICCPLCGSTKRHGGIHIRKGYYVCFKCGSSRLDYMLSNLLHMSLLEVKKLLKEYGSSISYLSGSGVKDITAITKVDMPGEPLKSCHKKYLKGRGYIPELLEREYGLLGTTFKEPGWEWMIIIPMYHGNRLVSWQGRSIREDATLRYLGASVGESIIHYKNLLYGESRLPDKKRIGLLEGLFDLYRMENYGANKGWACTFGSSLSPQQLGRLMDYEEVYFMLDESDKAAQEKAKKYVTELRAFGVNAVRIEPGYGEKDPDSYNMEQVREINRELGFV